MTKNWNHAVGATREERKSSGRVVDHGGVWAACCSRPRPEPVALCVLHVHHQDLSALVNAISCGAPRTAHGSAMANISSPSPHPGVLRQQVIPLYLLSARAKTSEFLFQHLWYIPVRGTDSELARKANIEASEF